MTFIWPIADPVITRDFYYKSSIYVGGQHAALDLIPRGRPATGEPIRAVADGTVAGAGWDFYSGFLVAVDHAAGWRSTYRHLYGQTPVSVGQRISQGQIIGNVGNTGYSLGAHLHFDLWNRNKVRDDAAIFYKNGWYAVDPELYLGQEDSMDQAEFNRMFAEAVKSVPVQRQDERGDPTSGGHTLGIHLEGLFQAIPTKSKINALIAEWIGPRDQTIARIDRQLHEHNGDTAAHGGNGGITEAEARDIAQEEDGKLKVTK